MEKLEINQQDKAFIYQVGKDIAHLEGAVAALQAAVTAQQGKKTQWVQKVTAKPGTVFGGMAQIKVHPNLVNKICAVKLGDYTPTFEQLGDYFEMQKNEDSFPIYFIALADQHEHVDFETEVE
ncbi:hypothetical protein [Haemophilus seminalis]|jgi:hypothetical protein|uniref:Uncharacterized protein n=1 Tax=Haemophilus seminalis TaxID=2582921 RepID=A0ABQ6SJI6_9PAST|nr:hypothetical protein [Haemophilus seminalis]KAA5522642.1 hypothetical protein F2S80_08515 [Haemophilus seminalis]